MVEERMGKATKRLKTCHGLTCQALTFAELDKFGDETTDLHDAIQDIQQHVQATTETMGLREIAKELILGSVTYYRNEPNNHFLILDSNRQCYFVEHSLECAVDRLCEVMVALQIPLQPEPNKYYLETVQDYLSMQSWKLDRYVSIQGYSDATELRMTSKEETKALHIRLHPILKQCLTEPVSGCLPIPKGIMTAYETENSDFLSDKKQVFACLEAYRQAYKQHILQADLVLPSVMGSIVPGEDARLFFIMQYEKTWIWQLLWNFMQDNPDWTKSLAETDQLKLITGDSMLDDILTWLRSTAVYQTQAKVVSAEMCLDCSKSQDLIACDHCKKQYCSQCIMICKECQFHFCPDMCYECEVCEESVCQDCIPGECEWCEEFHCGEEDCVCPEISAYSNPPPKLICWSTFQYLHDCFERFMKPHEEEPIASELYQCAEELASKKWSISWNDLPGISWNDLPQGKPMTMDIPCKFDIDNKLAQRFAFINSGTEAIVFALGKDCVVKRRVCSGRDYEFHLKKFSQNYPGMVLEEIPLIIREEKNTGDYDLFVQQRCVPLKCVKDFETNIRKQWFSDMPSDFNEFLFWEWGLIGDSFHVFDWN